MSGTDLDKRLDELLRELRTILIRLAEINDAIGALRQLVIRVSGQPPQH